MLWSTALGVLLASWSILFLLDFYFRSYNYELYIKFVESTGVVISPFQLRWYTRGLENCLSRGWLLRFRNTIFGNVWFTVGTGQALFCMIFIIIYLSKVLLDQVNRILVWYMQKYVHQPTQLQHTTATSFESAPSDSGGGLVPVIPGVNLPWSQFPLLIVVLIIAGVVHELGHAFAAHNANVGVNGFGVFILAIYPGAFTEIDSSTLQSASTINKLRIYCAGIWHNFVTALLFILLLNSLPWLLAPFYTLDKGVQVLEVSPNSGVSGPTGLRPGQVVYAISNCPVLNEQMWQGCLNSLPLSNFGNCLLRKDVYMSRTERTHDVMGEVHCCPTNLTSSHLCFYIVNLVVSEPGQVRSGVGSVFDYSCLPARYVTDHHMCNASITCSQRTICVYPALFNSTKLLRLMVANNSRPVLFVGHPNELLHTVQVSSYVPYLGIFPSSIPPLLELVCKYVITFSLALAFLNAVPCFGLDGQFIVSVLFDSFLSTNRKLVRFRKTIKNVVLYCGTTILVLNVGLAVCKVIMPLI